MAALISARVEVTCARDRGLGNNSLFNGGIRGKEADGKSAFIMAATAIRADLNCCVTIMSLDFCNELEGCIISSLYWNMPEGKENKLFTNLKKATT